jgi:hypothetical protein
MENKEFNEINDDKKALLMDLKDMNLFDNEYSWLIDFKNTNFFSYENALEHKIKSNMIQLIFNVLGGDVNEGDQVSLNSKIVGTVIKISPNNRKNIIVHVEKDVAESNLIYTTNNSRIISLSSPIIIPESWKN